VRDGEDSGTAGGIPQLRRRGGWRPGAFALALAGALLLLVAGWLTAGPRGLVDWRALQAVALESDDWGLSGFVPSAAAWDGLRREDLAPGNFPAVYWNSTLEDSAMVADLAAVLAAHRGRDGRPAVLQPNYVLSALAWEDGRWRRYDLPALPRAYPRPGLWSAVAAAREAGVWQPELHAAWHYDPSRRREATAADATVREAAARGIMLFPGSEAARELGPWRSRSELSAELDTLLAVFGRAFGVPPASLIAPDYTWDDRAEALWSARGLTVIQAKREQRDPGLPRGLPGRGLKFLRRQWSRIAHQDRCYLERNCRLEPVQSPDPAAVVAACVTQTREAWRRGEPAIVETHRVNFAHAEAAVTALGRACLARYLDGLGSGALFLTDVEIAALGRHGTGARSVGGRVEARNGSHARRLLPVPTGAGTGRPAGPGAAAGDVYLTLLVLDAGFGTARP
jgi:hypothetical protein